MKISNLLILRSLAFLSVLLVIRQEALSWSGYDYAKGTFVEIESGNLVREGETIEVYDYDEGEYRDMEVEDIQGNELEVTDSYTGESRTFDMD